MQGASGYAGPTPSGIIDHNDRQTPLHVPEPTDVLHKVIASMDNKWIQKTKQKKHWTHTCPHPGSSLRTWTTDSDGGMVDD